MKKFNYLLTLGLLAVSTLAFAQDDGDDVHQVTISVPEVALLDIEAASSTTISLGPTAPTEAGSPITFTSATDNSLWLNYSSIIGSTTESSRTVTAQITSGTVPAGMTLSVVAGADAGNGDGTVGTPTAAVTLSGSAQNIITAIGSCYTGTGTSNGHQLTYTLALDAASGSYANLDFDDAGNINVTYTITNTP